MRESLLAGTFSAPQAGSGVPLAGRSVWDIIGVSARFLTAGSATVVIESGVADQWQTVYTIPDFTSDNQRQTVHIGGAQAPPQILPGETDLRANLTAVIGEVILAVDGSAHWLDVNNDADMAVIRPQVEDHSDRKRIMTVAEGIVVRYLTRTAYDVPVANGLGFDTYPRSWPAAFPIDDTPQQAHVLERAAKISLPGFGEAMKQEIAAQASYTAEQEAAACVQDANSGAPRINSTAAYPNLGRYIDSYIDRDARGWLGRG